MTRKKGKGETPEDKRKERVIHTRVPAVLDTELKRLASSLRVPVSNLVRTILEDAVSAAEAVGKVAEEELRGAAERLGQERERLRGVAAESGEAIGRAIKGDRPLDDQSPAEAEAETHEEGEDPLEGALGFQPLILARETRCARCGARLKAGTEALLAVMSGGGPGPVVGPECAPGSSPEPTTTEEEDD